jgi:hypothetical protein
LFHSECWLRANWISVTPGFSPVLALAQERQAVSTACFANDILKPFQRLMALVASNTWLKPGVNEKRSLLIDRIGRHDLDALDRDAFGRLAHFSRAASGDRRAPDFSQHIIAFNQFAKGRVLMIEAADVPEADEEL